MKEKENYEVYFWRHHDKNELPIYPFCSEISLRYIQRRVGRCQYPFLLICGVDSGSVRFIFDDRKITIEKNGVLLIPSHTPFYFESYSTGGHYRKFALELQGKLLNEYLECLGLKHVYCQNDLWEEFISTFEKVHKFNMSGEKEDIPEMVASIVQLLHAFSGRNQQSSEESGSLLLTACHWIDRNLDSPIDLRRLEKHLNVSRSTLTRIFKKGKQVNPRQYWINRRLQEAALLLNHSKLSIKEISFRLGYSSQFHFSNEFRRTYGMSPLAYRRLGLI